MRGFVRACLVKPVAAEDFETALCWNMAVAPRVRASLAAREIDGDDVLRGLAVPLLVTQGRSDTVVLPAMAEHILAVCPAAEASWYDGADPPRPRLTGGVPRHGGKSYCDADQEQAWPWP